MPDHCKRRPSKHFPSVWILLRKNPKKSFYLQSYLSQVPIISVSVTIHCCFIAVSDTSTSISHSNRSCFRHLSLLLQILIIVASDTLSYLSYLLLIRYLSYLLLIRYYQREQRKTKLLQRIEAAAGQVNSVR